MSFLIARSELKDPPKRVSWADLSIEASALIAAAYGMLWLI